MMADAYRTGLPRGVVYVGPDLDFAQGLRSHLVAHGVGLAVYSRGDEAVEALSGVRQGLLLLDLRINGSGSPQPEILDPAAILGQAKALDPAPAWVCLADGTNLPARLEALRSGASACFTTPPPDLASRLLVLLGAAKAEPYRILVVDDQEVPAILVGGILNRAGMVVRTVFDPMTVLEAMDEFRPDLILMDLHMPGADGMELTSIIREHETFCTTPIVFLSVEEDRDRQIAALRVGADEFLTKPVAPELLLQTVRQRVERARSVKERQAWAPAQDPTTGLWTRGHLLQRIDRVIVDGGAKADRFGLIYIYVESNPGLDTLRRAGALGTAMARAAEAVRRVIDPADVAARLGEHSIGVLLARSEGRLLATCAEALRSAVAGTTLAVGGTPVRLIASLGVGLFQPRADDAITMVSRAKAACARARKAGGDRVERYVPTLPAGTSPDRSKRLTELIRDALKGKGLSLMYQPLVTMQRRTGERFEAVLRLRAKDGEMIPPFDFLPAAAQAGLMPSIDRWVLARALDDIRTYRTDRPALSLMVRQTMATLAADDWIEWVREGIVSRDLIQHRPVLMFEVDDVAANLELAKRRFEELQRLRIDLCLNRMDDAPLAQAVLGSFTWAMVRLHGEVLAQPTDALKTLIGAIHLRGTQVIATGIEDPQTIARVWDCGVDFIQGNFIQAPAAGLEFDFTESELI
jgi:PleD family two-component response regulator/EAL domain-containing protein (putative c-di-GMP-specific phosphodiesterase class I)